jgi:uncharacterized protein
MNSVKKAPRALIMVVLVLLSLFLLTRTVREIKEGKSFAPRDTISVSGEGSLFSRPDIGQVTITVSKEDITAEGAQVEATRAINSVVDFLKANHIDEGDIKTTNYSINPRYDYLRDEGRILRGWTVTQNLVVKIRDLDSVGKILSGATGNGANQIGGLTFTFDDPDALQEEARSMAIDDAKEKAEVLADDLGVNLKRIVSFSESGGRPPVYFRAEALDVSIGSSAAPAPNIPVGENEIKSTVTIVYEIR